MKEQIIQQEMLKQEVKLNMKQSKPVKMALKRAVGVIILLLTIGIIAILSSGGDTQIHTNGVGFNQEIEMVDNKDKVLKKKKKYKKNLNSRRKHYLTKFN